jgi:hypothetical protein
MLTDDEAITLAILHAPSTFNPEGSRTEEFCTYPFYRSLRNVDRTKHVWWVHRNFCCSEDWDSLGEAAQWYCYFFKLVKGEDYERKFGAARRTVYQAAGLKEDD